METDFHKDCKGHITPCKFDLVHIEEEVDNTFEVDNMVK